MQGIKKIKAEGNPYSAGFVYGKKAKEKIRNNVKIYKRIFRNEVGLSWDKVEEKVKSGIEEIKSFDERVIEFMNGIADGSKLNLDDILAINYRYEFLFSYSVSCTSIGVSNENFIIAQNWDFRKELQDSLINLELKINNCPRIFTQVEAGLLCHRGLNSEGIALCINAVRSKDDELKFAIPLVSVLPWLILNSSNITKAIDLITQAKRFSSINYLIARNELIFNIEIIPRDFEYIEPNEDGLIVHTNHFLSERFRSLGRNISSCSFTRQIRANYLIKRLKNKVGINEVMKILRDHYDHPYSICRHEADTRGSLGIVKTLASTIFDISKSEIYYTIGNPCRSEYTKVINVKAQ